MSPAPVPRLPGIVFENAPAAVVTEVHRAHDPREVVYGNARGQIFNGDRITWGFAAMRLDRRLPHIVLENRRGGGIISTDASEGIAGGQRLRLEGDFDRTFALHCPAGHERDALYLFTPDVMARLLDSAAALDVEVVDDWLLIYATRPISPADQATWPRLTAAVDALSDKVGAWARWSDAGRPGSTAVAPTARRVRPVSPWRWVWRFAAVMGALAALGLLWEALT